MFSYTRYFLLIVASVFLAFSIAVSASQRVEVVATDFNRPWSIAWINETQVLISERSGQSIHLDLISNDRTAIDNVPPVTAIGQGGLLDVQVTTLRNTLWVYLALSGVNVNQTTGTELGRARLHKKALTNVTQLYAMPSTTKSGHHFGGRIAPTDQHVFLTIRDGGERERAQDVSDPAGSIIRLNLDGSIPSDNSIFASPNARPELCSGGHRNPQGLAFDSKGHLFAHEHGPQGGDEINRIDAGLNYGWPTITYGRNCGIGTPVGEGVEKEGLEQPLIYWNPSIAPRA